MKADPHFRFAGSDFWANVRTISERAGYAGRGTRKRSRYIKIHSIDDMVAALRASELGTAHLVDPHSGHPTDLAERLRDYFAYRADVLANHVRPNLMCGQCARRTFHRLRQQLGTTMAVPMNKQSGEMAQPAYLTGIINMIVEAEIGDTPCDYNPGGLTTFTRGGAPLKTLSRRHDGGFPSIVNPIAVWEVKEYYYTTTFGSKISDGVYITQLDGLEIEEARGVSVDVQLVLMVDAYFTWWIKGLSYLCRLIDLLHMGYVDEILFGTEVLERLPVVVREWMAAFDAGSAIATPVASAAKSASSS